MVSEAISELALLAVAVVFLSVIVAYAGSVIVPPEHIVFNIVYDNNHLKIINLNRDVIYLNKLKILLINGNNIIELKGIYDQKSGSFIFIDSSGHVCGRYNKALMNFGDCLDLDLSTLNLVHGLYFVNILYESKCFTTSIVV